MGIHTSSVDETIVNLKKKWLPIYVVALVASIVILVALLYLYFSTNYDQYMSGALLVAMLVAYISWSLGRLLKIRPASTQLLTLLKCDTCGYEEERNYAEGDALFQEKGVCPKCNSGKMVVMGIFVRKIEGQKSKGYSLFKV